VPGESLTFSLALPIRAADWSGLSLAVGLAVADALDPCPHGAAPRIGLKWPNDLMLSVSDQASSFQACKLGGILIESLPAAGRRMAVIGIGINIAPQLAGQDASALSQGYAGLQSLRPELDAAGALACVAGPLLIAIEAFERDGFAPLRERYAVRDVLAGRPVTTTLPELPSGTAAGVDADGALCLDVDGRRHRVASGEVSVRPAAEPVPHPKEESAC
jgi:BirA family biotin operon repressor/biotin-[acetyl-CoA-carboxylase] ligase